MKNFIIIIIFVFFLSAINLYGLENISINIKQEASLNGENIMLKDIADIKDSEGLKEQIENIIIGPSPDPGIEKTLSKSFIESRLRSSKLIQNGSLISIPKAVKIKRISQLAPTDMLKKLFDNYIALKFPDRNFKITDFKVLLNKKFPKGKLIFNIIENSGKIFSGQINLMISANVDGKPYSKIPVIAKLERYQKVVCAKTSISRNKVLTKEDLCIVSMNVSKAPINLFESIDDAIGKRVKGNIQQGSYIQSSHLESPPIINKGDIIKLSAKNGIISVSTLGIAKTSGAKNDNIRVENMSSKRTVLGKIINESTVEVIF